VSLVGAADTKFPSIGAFAKSLRAGGSLEVDSTFFFSGLAVDETSPPDCRAAARAGLTSFSSSLLTIPKACSLTLEDFTNAAFRFLEVDAGAFFTSPFALG